MKPEPTSAPKIPKEQPKPAPEKPKTTQEKRKSPHARVAPLKFLLPTDRMKPEKLIEIIRATAAAGGSARQAVQLKDIGKLVGLTESTLTLATPFLVQAGFLEKRDAGFAASPEALEFKRAHDLGSGTAAERLAPIFLRSWCFEAIRPKLEYQGITENAAILDISLAANAQASDGDKVRALLEMMELTGAVQRDGMLLVVRRPDGPGGIVAPKVEQKIVDEPTSKPTQRSASAGAGGISFHLSIDVSMDELLTWDPARISAFLVGMQSIITAHKGIADAAKNGTP